MKRANNVFFPATQFMIPYLIIFFLLISSTVALAETDEQNVLTIQKAIDTATQNNPGLAQITARYQAVSQVSSQLGTLPDPILRFNAMNFPTDTFDRAQEPMTQVQIGISQQFPFPGKLGLREEAAEREAQAVSFSVDEMRLKLISAVTNTWWQVFYLDRAIETIEINQALLRQFVDVALTKYENGKGLQQDVLLAQLELSKLIDQGIVIDSLRRHQVIKLNRLMGVRASEVRVLPTEVERTLPPIKEEETLYLIADKSRPVIKVREQKVAAAVSRLDLAKKDYYPDFQLSVIYGSRTGVNPGPSSEPRADLFSVMLGVKIPLYAMSKQSKAIEQKSSEQQASSFALADERVQMMADISADIADYHQAQQQFILLEKGILPQARQTVQSMLAGYQVNKVDFLNLVRSQVTLFNFELQYWKVLVRAKQAARRIEANIGEESIYE